MSITKHKRENERMIFRLNAKMVLYELSDPFIDYT
jgi:hypothetical protein